MITQRYNIFNQIHKGLRAYLFDTALMLQQTELSGDANSLAVVNQLTQLVEAFESHASHEDHFINEPLEVIDPKISTMFRQEHELDHRLGILLTNLLDDWTNAGSRELRLSIGAQLFYTFNEFVAFNLYHMNKEELDLNEVLWKNYSDLQIREVEQRITQSVPPDRMMATMKWMVKGINDAELIHWMEAVKINAPEQVYDLLVTLVRRELSPSRSAKVERALISYAS